MMSLDISDSAQIYAAFVVYLDLLEGNSGKRLRSTSQQMCLPVGAVEDGALVGPFSPKSLGVLTLKAVIVPKKQ